MHRSSNCHQAMLGEDGSRVNKSNVVNSSSTTSSSSSGALDSLPKQFVDSMKTLFDIMDDKRTGFVRLVDIEKGWQDDGSKDLPYGVIDSLRKVTPASGMLSFERFCAGLKICLLRNQAEQRKCRRISTGDAETVLSNSGLTAKPLRPPSAPLLDIENPVPNSQWAGGGGGSNNTATVRPNNAVQSQQRALSLPQLSPDSETYSTSEGLIMPDFFGPPPKPPRSAIIMQNNNHKSTFNKAEIRNALQSWQMGVLMNEMESKDKRKTLVISPLGRLTTRGTADGGTNGTALSNQQSPTAGNQHGKEFYQRKENGKRRESRRHTLQNGIDYNLLKRLKQFEAEKDVLLQGLTAVEQAREWYLKQIGIVEEKIKYLGHSGVHVEQWTEAHQERLGFQRARVNEINRHLAALQFIWERGGYPSHMNLAVYNRPPPLPATAAPQYPPPRPANLPPPLNHPKPPNRYDMNPKSERIAAPGIVSSDNEKHIRDHNMGPLLRPMTHDSMSKTIAVKDTDNIF